MKFLADESLEAVAVRRLREANHDIWSVSEKAPGLEDHAVLLKAVRTGRILITADKDFAELAFLQRRASGGIILIRMPRSKGAQKAERIVQVVRAHGTTLASVMTVVDAVAVRIRPFPRARR